MLALQSQGYLQQLTGWQLNDLLFSRSGIVLVMTFNIFPVVYFAVSRSLLASGTRLAVVARVHGASAWRAFWHVTLPMLSGAGGGDAAGVYPRHRGVWRTGGAGQPGGSGDADGRY
jgi:iron(III) transport system permease protein